METEGDSVSQPHRQFRLVFALEADTRDDLASALFNMATAVDRNELTVGVSGGSYSGYIYELLQDPAQSHDTYFAQLKEHLANRPKP